MSVLARPMELSWKKKALFTIVANLVTFGVLFGIGELTVRWRLEGGASAALKSFVGRGPSDTGEATENWLVYDPSLGYKLNPALPGINSLGIDHDEIAIDKPAGLFRVVVLGDSIAHATPGFVSLLRTRFHDVREGPAEIINAAIPGYTTYQERILLERDLLAAKPDLVILQYCLNDNHRFLHTLNETGKWLIAPEAKRILFPNRDSAAVLILQSSYFLRELAIRVLTLSRELQDDFPWNLTPAFAAAWHDETWFETEAHLRAIRDRLTKIDARFAVVAVPYGPQLDEAFLDRDKDYTLKPQRKLAEISRRLDVPLLDLHAAFLANRDRNLYTDGIHLSPAGHQVVTQQLLEFVQTEQLASGRPH